MFVVMSTAGYALRQEGNDCSHEYRGVRSPPGGQGSRLQCEIFGCSQRSHIALLTEGESLL